MKKHPDATLILNFYTSGLALYFRLICLCNGSLLLRAFLLILTEDLKNRVFFDFKFNIVLFSSKKIS